jgi:hypothetical protein
MEHKAPERAIKGVVMLQSEMLDIEMSCRGLRSAMLRIAPE